MSKFPLFQISEGSSPSTFAQQIQDKSRAVNKQDENLKLPLLAVDGGGTKTLAAITDQKGSILSTGQSGASNYQVVGFEHAVSSLTDAINNAISALEDIKENTEKQVSFQRAVFALAGIDTAKDLIKARKIVNEALEKTGIDVQETIVENDAQSALLGATNHQPGILLISGTGSIAFAFDGKETYERAGGFGHKVGDEGSGYWIGIKALKSVLKMHDARGPATILSEKILSYLQLKDYEELHNWVYSPDFTVDKVASLAKFVDEGANNGDEVSRRILSEAADELFRLVFSVAKKTRLTGVPFTLVLLGGVLENIDYIKNRLINQVKEVYPEVKVFMNKEAPIDLIIRRGLYEL